MTVDGATTPPGGVSERLRPALPQRRRDHLYRSRRVVEGRRGAQVRIGSSTLVSFCSNDYLGLAADPRVIQALQQAAESYGVGSGSAHLVSGHHHAHHALEEALAEFTGRPRALLFSTGYMANLGVLGALLGRGDTLLQDRLNHASLVDGGLLSRANVKRYAHADTAALERRLAAPVAGRVLVATDGVFSMDGDLAPLPAMAALCRQHGAWLMVDDAHGLGVLGTGGRGTLEHFGLTVDQVPVLVGTLGKSFGTAGAFVAGSEELIETLIQQARSYIYTTAMPPAVAAATLASLQIAGAEQWRRERLAELVTRFRERAGALGLTLIASESPIQPIIAGSTEQALRWSEALEEQGLLVTAIRPPTVPEGAARLRVTFSASHSDDQLERLLEALARLPREGA